MNQYIYSGGCHCGNIALRFYSTLPCIDMETRACDCDFCRKYGAAYVSDPNGSLEAKIKNQDKILCYTQGSGVAKFVICGLCGVLTVVKYSSGDSIYAAINARTLDDFFSFKDSVTVSPRTLSKEDKQSRWSKIWISDVTIEEVV